MRVAFRADASVPIGTGHVMRCLTLARRLRDSGAEALFACLDIPGNCLSEIQRAGFQSVPVESLNTQSLDWLIVDHYGLDARYESAMRTAAKRIMVIDDLANRAHDCDLLLDQNLYASMERRYEQYVPAHARTLCGPRFALLRPEFLAARSRVVREGPLRRLLVFFGGSDPTNETSKTLRALLRLGSVDIGVDVLIGGTNPYREEIEGLARSLPSVSVLYQTNAISELMLRADLAIGGGGATSWERCCLGLPSISVAVAANQVAISDALAEAGCQEFLGPTAEVSEAMIAAAIARCLADFAAARASGLRGMQLVDGLGTDRVMAAMESL